MNTPQMRKRDLSQAGPEVQRHLDQIIAVCQACLDPTLPLGHPPPAHGQVVAGEVSRQSNAPSISRPGAVLMAGVEHWDERSVRLVRLQAMRSTVQSLPGSTQHVPSVWNHAELWQTQIANPSPLQPGTILLGRHPFYRTRQSVLQHAFNLCAMSQESPFAGNEEPSSSNIEM